MRPTPTVLDKRQLWNVESTPAPTESCTTMHLASGGVIVFGSHSTTTLTQSVLFRPYCTGCPLSNGSDSCIQDDNNDPFYASITPIVYVIAVCTVFAWTLLLILLLSPNRITSFRRVNSSSIWQSPFTRASSSFFNGSRPWLQKVGALLTAISMIVATADLFQVAEDQYARRVANAHDFRRVVIGGLDIRILRVISDVFLWLAQIQTLIRVFPRHKEKLLIKWIGFFLILLDIVFSILHGFVVESDIYSPTQYADALSALSYLFQLSLNLLYATWIMYYAATKRRYAFYHNSMPNISIVAFVSLFAILAPAGFFVADMIVPDVSGWGDYFRWVSAAASSIAVWEWVERIEKLEREEKKDGILGREIYDGDEMIDDTPADSHGKGHRSGSQGDSSIVKYGSPFYNLRRLVPYSHSRSTPATSDVPTSSADRSLDQRISLKVFRRRGRRGSSPHSPQTSGQPVPTASAGPVDRSQAPSADSTIYNIRYQAAPNSTTPPIPPIGSVSPTHTPQHVSPQDRTTTVTFKTTDGVASEQTSQPRASSISRISKRTALTRPLRLPAHLFRRARKSPPLEIKNAMSLDSAVTTGDAASSVHPASESSTAHSQARSGLRAKFSGLGSESSRHDSGRRSSIQSSTLTATVIPAPPRGHTWSPQDRRHSPLAVIQGGGTPGTVENESTPKPDEDPPASRSASAALSTKSTNDCGPETVAPLTSSAQAAAGQDKTWQKPVTGQDGLSKDARSPEDGSKKTTDLREDGKSAHQSIHAPALQAGSPQQAALTNQPKEPDRPQT